MNRGRHKKRNKDNFYTLPELHYFMKRNLEILLQRAKSTYFPNLCINNDYFATVHYSVSNETWYLITSYYIYDSHYIDGFMRTVEQRLLCFHKGTIYYLRFRFGQKEHIIKYKIR